MKFVRRYPPFTALTRGAVCYYYNQGNEPASFRRRFLFDHMGKIKDIDEEHDLTDQKKYESVIKHEDRISKAPCGKCADKDHCTVPFYCKRYQAWKKKYMKRRYGC